jgi:hypothetical protein
VATGGGPLGIGGTAEIRQSLINPEISFAFKRITMSKAPEDDFFRAILR